MDKDFPMDLQRRSAQTSKKPLQWEEQRKHLNELKNKIVKSNFFHLFLNTWYLIFDFCSFWFFLFFLLLFPFYWYLFWRKHIGIFSLIFSFVLKIIWYNPQNIVSSLHNLPVSQNQNYNVHAVCILLLTNQKVHGCLQLLQENMGSQVVWKKK